MVQKNFLYFFVVNLSLKALGLQPESMDMVSIMVRVEDVSGEVWGIDIDTQIKKPRSYALCIKSSLAPIPKTSPQLG